MIQVSIASLAVDGRSQPVLILRPMAEGPSPTKLLPIWIGHQEATAIVLAVEGTSPPRPLVYDLFARLLAAVDAHVERVEVTRIEEGTFYAEITLATPAGPRIIDARPSDSVALAVRVDAPIFVAEAVLEEAGIVEPEDQTDEDSEVAEFAEFLDSVNPEDFRG